MGEAQFRLLFSHSVICCTDFCRKSRNLCLESSLFLLKLFTNLGEQLLRCFARSFLRRNVAFKLHLFALLKKVQKALIVGGLVFNLTSFETLPQVLLKRATRASAWLVKWKRSTSAIVASILWRALRDKRCVHHLSPIDNKFISDSIVWLTLCATNCSYYSSVAYPNRHLQQSL